MRKRRQGFPGRLGMVVLACLMLLGIVVPAVMADPPEAEPPPAGEGISQASESGAPSRGSILAAYRAYQREAEEHEAELEEQPFVAEREHSQHAYEDASPAEAEHLFRSTFGEVFAKLNAEPSRLLGEIKVDKNLGHGAAVVTTEGRTEIFDADQPIEVKDAEGEMEKVDLSLERGPEGFQPENPVTEVSIGATAEEGVEVGEEGLTVTQVGAEESNGRLLGDKNVFFGEVEEGSDTDLMVSPTSHGVELFDMLRSIDSPDTLRFHLELPAGDSLRGSPGGGGAEIVDGEGDVVDVLPPPHGEDAQGTEVPVEMAIEGDSVVLHTEHREEDLAYPVMIDPEVWQEWGWWFEGRNTQGLNYWQAQQNGPGQTYAWRPEEPTSYAGWDGLFLGIPWGEEHEGEEIEWYLNAPNYNTYLSNVTINPFKRVDGPVSQNGCVSASPFDYEGYWNPQTETWSGMEYNNTLQGWTHVNWSGLQYDFGLASPVEFDSYCWRDIGAGGISFFLGDTVSPNLVSVTPNLPSGWIGANTSFTVSAYAIDEGLGVSEFYFYPGPEVEAPHRLVGCLGTYESRCPYSYSQTYTFYGREFAKGEREVEVSARSATDKNSNTRRFTLKVDLEPPEIHLHGQLEAAVQKGESHPGEKQGQGGPELTQPVYNLEVEAKDGVEGTTEGKLKQSGVKTVEVTVTDATGTKVESTKAFPNTNPKCGEGSCAEGPTGKGITYSIPMTGLTAGKHHLIVKAWDLAGNEPSKIEQEFEYIPATGLTEEDVTQRFLLPDGKNHGESSYRGPELAVNVMNGNVVYRQRDVEVEGPTTNLEVELFYNSQLPKEESSEFGTGWTLSQTPTLKPAPSGAQATALTSESELTGRVALPQAVGEGHFSDKLGAYIEKESGGGYAVSEGGSTPATLYNSKGRPTEAQTSPTAAVEYSYAGEHLSEIAVNDPGATSIAPPPLKKAPSIVPTYVSSFGSTGTGNGQFSHPADVALDAKGNEWVADSGNNRVEEFTPGGEFVKSLGSAGTGNGQFSTPKSLAFDSAGDLWVDDSGNSRLEEFGPTGTFIKAVGTNGSGSGQFNHPEGMAIEPNGHILVSDTYNYRVVELNAAGEWIKVLGPSGSGEMEPTGIDVSPEGKIWIADWSHNRVIELGEAGEVIRRVGSEGGGEGQFRRPDAIAVGALGEVWVGDQNNERVQELTKEGKYVTQFGSSGTGAGQFAFSYPLGIATDNEGSLFVTDTNNNRVEHWQVPHFGYKPVYAASFGSAGTGPGQYRHPGGLAVDDQGNVWIPDVENNRIQELNRKGEFVRQLGSVGSGNGQFRSPKSIAFTNEGEFWVADSGNNRLQEFNEHGEFIKAVGTLGSGNGQFNGPEAIAIAPNGHIWVADTYNYRIVELDEKGNFIRVVNPAGLGHIEPTGIAFGPGGNAWIADWAGNRVVEINPAGELVRQFGTAGSGNGQFAQPDTVAVDQRGIVYVVDQNNRRVQVFDQEGKYLSQFGSSGSGAGQFSFAYPTGIAADARGDIWVSDNNNRIQKWMTGSWVPVEEEAIPAHDDPSVSVTTSAGLVTAVAGAQAGSHHYTHSGELLTGDEGPEGTTHYEYEAGRLKKITLPNGTTATIVYDTTGRATEVTVAPAGSGPKTTKFRYIQEVSTEVAKNHGLEAGSREVEVEPEKEKRTFYAIDAAGDVVKSWNVEAGPAIVRETGSFVTKKEGELSAAETQELFIRGFAEEGIKSVQFIVNGTTVVDEKTCSGTAVECEHLELQWIVEPQDLSPGTMWIEVVLTGRVEEKRTAQRWWVTIPYTPPPPPGIPQPPKYKEVQEFRENWGLDLDLNPITEEMVLHERIRETIGAWHNPETEAGQVAYATWELWGVPLRYVDEQELEYRKRYMEHDIPLIEQWGKTHSPGTYAGVYVDERAGGLMRVGFTSGASASLAALKSEVALMEPARVAAFQSPPALSLGSLEGAAAELSAAGESLPSGVIISTGTDVIDNALVVGTENPAAATEAVRAAVGPNIPLITKHEEAPQETAAWQRNEGQMLAGDFVSDETSNPEVLRACSAGFGAYQSTAQGKRYFLLTAAHCGAVGRKVYRDAGGTRPIGEVFVTDRAGGETGMVSDAAAIRVGSPNLSPEKINLGANGAITVKEVGVMPEAGKSELCHAGAALGAAVCGPIPSPSLSEFRGIGGPGQREVMVCFQARVHNGDSGGPVWIRGTHAAVGIEAGGLHEIAPKEFSETCAVPLVTRPGIPARAAALTNGGLGSLKVRLYE